MTSRDRRAIHRYTLATNAYQARHWWYSRGPWTHITVTTVLFLGFCAAVAFATYPYLERMVAA